MKFLYNFTTFLSKLIKVDKNWPKMIRIDPDWQNSANLTSFEPIFDHILLIFDTPELNFPPFLSIYTTTSLKPIKNTNPIKFIAK